MAAICHKEFESAIGIERADINCDSRGVYNPLIQAMGAWRRGNTQDALLANRKSTSQE